MWLGGGMGRAGRGCGAKAYRKHRKHRIHNKLKKADDNSLLTERGGGLLEAWPAIAGQGKGIILEAGFLNYGHTEIEAGEC